MDINFNRKIVNTVKEFFNKHQIDVPFFIAGGSAFSSFTNKNYDDIDVYFYNDRHYNTAIKRLFVNDNDVIDHEQIFKQRIVVINSSKTALTCLGSNNSRIQLIAAAKGTPQEVFDTFDLNCSKICITDSYEIIKDKSFSIDIEVDFNNFTAQTCDRYRKYVVRKRAVDKERKALFSIFDYLISNYKNKISGSYSGSETPACDVLKNFISTLVSANFHQYIHDQFINKFHKSDLVDEFIFMYGTLTEVTKPCDEFIAAHIYFEEQLRKCYGHHSQTLFCNERINNVRENFAEYFI